MTGEESSDNDLKMVGSVKSVGETRSTLEDSGKLAVVRKQVLGFSSCNELFSPDNKCDHDAMLYISERHRALKIQTMEYPRFVDPKNASHGRQPTSTIEIYV